MHADSFFSIGSTHKVCQDYARTGHLHNFEQHAWAFLSDGCSSSPDTDLGARLLVLHGIEYLTHEGVHLDMGQIARNAVSHTIPVHANCLDATLMALVETEIDIKAMVAGDGVLAGMREDGTIDHWVFGYAEVDGGVAPAYPNYLNDSSRFDNYLSLGHGQATVAHFENGVPVSRWEKTVSTENFSWVISVPPSTYKVVAIFSDGVESFYTKTNNGAVTRIPTFEVLQHFMAIKQPLGQFVTRRCQRFFSTTANQLGWKHADDFSMAAIWCREG